MCGRTGYVNSDFKTYGVSKIPSGFTPIYNGAPSMRLPQIYVHDGEKDVALMKFGLVPFWSKEPTTKFSTINAKAETIFTSPAYRMPIMKQRSLTPVTFYFEWKQMEDKTKQPYVFRLKSHEPFALGSIYDIWKDAEDKEFPSFSIITTEPNEVASKFHHRMPLIIPREHWDTWLHESLTQKDIQQLMVPFSKSEEMEIYPVSKLVNSPANDSPDVVKKV